jgi:hypothetical protein
VGHATFVEWVERPRRKEIPLSLSPTGAHSCVVPPELENGRIFAELPSCEVDLVFAGVGAVTEKSS